MDHTKMIEKWAVRYGQTKNPNYLEALEKSKKALNEILRIQSEALYVLNVKEVRKREALEAIKEITQGLTEFNPTYAKIYNTACSGLEDEIWANNSSSTI